MQKLIEKLREVRMKGSFDEFEKASQFIHDLEHAKEFGLDSKVEEIAKKAKKFIRDYYWCEV